MMGLLANVTQDMDAFATIDFDTVPLSNIPKCHSGYIPDAMALLGEELFGIEDEAKNNASCVTVGYGIIGQNSEMYAPEYNKIHDIMKILSTNQNLTYE
jgi:hypothetical protein